jgi:predicted metal-binding membrane protein
MMPITRDRAIVLASLAAIAGLAWAYLFGFWQDMAGMGNMPGMDMPSAPTPFLFTVIMWTVMMVGMMLPSALPMILLFTTVQRKQGSRPVLTTGTFVAGYLVTWGAFAVVAAGLQTELGRMALLSPSLAFISRWLAGLTFLVAAAYEFSPLKNRCLTQCSSPLSFITVHWRPGIAGALRMGVVHGSILRWLLLGLDAAAVHGWCDEPRLGCNTRCSGSFAESSAVSPADRRSDGDCGSGPDRCVALKVGHSPRRGL